jgi:hypothetical protein
MLSPEIESQMNVGGTLGGIGNVIEGIQSGAGVPENIFRFLSGQKTGRQGVANTATQNYLNQLNIAKLQGDIAQDPYKLAKIKFEVDKAPFELGEIQNKFYQSSFKTQGIKKEFKKLEDEGKIEELNTKIRSLESTLGKYQKSVALQAEIDDIQRNIQPKVIKVFNDCLDEIKKKNEINDNFLGS